LGRTSRSQPQPAAAAAEPHIHLCGVKKLTIEGLGELILSILSDILERVPDRVAIEYHVVI
jgi:hypothetical protein